MVVYVKIRSNGEYHSHNFAHAVFGFREMGAEIIKYEKIDDIYDSVTKEDIVLDYIAQSNTIMNKFGICPQCEDYGENRALHILTGGFSFKLLLFFSSGVSII